MRAGSKVVVKLLLLLRTRRGRSGLGECLGRSNILRSRSKVGVKLLLLLRHWCCWSAQKVVVKNLLLRKSFLFPGWFLE